MSGQSAESGYPRKAVPGEILHDRGSLPHEGWFILGEDGYFDVDNSVWCEFADTDAPWTTEHFDLLGGIRHLIAEGPALAVDYRQAMSTPLGCVLHEVVIPPEQGGA